MNELTNLRKSYCYKCNRLLGYKPADRTTLEAPETLCFYCEQAEEKQIAKYQEIGKVLIDKTCDVFLVIASMCAAAWVLRCLIG